MPYWHSLLPGGKPVQICTTPEEFEKRVDAVVIGGGLTGMSCAYHLAMAGETVKVLEARGLADGATGRNGGHSWPEPHGSVDSLQLENQDMIAVRTFVLSLSEEWQKRIELRINGGISPSFNEVQTDPC